MHLKREHQTWIFRRRVPRRLQKRLGRRELYRSLSTTSQREARKLAALMFAASEELFEMAADEALTDEDLRAAARHWLATPRWRRQLKFMVDDLPPGDLRRERGSLAGEVVDPGELVEALGMDAHHIEAEEASSALESAGYREPTAADIGRMKTILLEAVETYVDRRFEQVFHPERAAAPAAPEPAPPVKDSPLFSDLTESFLAEKSRSSEDHRGYSQQVQRQSRATFRLWQELIGDRPLREYTGADAGRFRELLLKLPASHGKSRSNPATAREAIERASPDAQRLTMKTVKRHFSTLSQYWAWLQPRDHVERNVFRGFTFPGTKSSKKKRKDWSAEDLRKLFGSAWYAGFSADSAERWLPLVAVYSGLRLEEIARLRPGRDITEIDGVTCFVVQDHVEPAPWSPKTEAGERVVPVHSRLIALGFLDLVERRAALPYLWPDLPPSGPDGKKGYAYSREFSRRKALLGVDKRTTFHSFRHTARTILESTNLQERWIDAVFGHDDSTRSEGGRTYAKRVAVQRLREVIEAIQVELPLP